MVFNLILGRRLIFYGKLKISIKSILIIAAIVIQIIGVFLVSLDASSTSNKSNYNLYHGELQPNSAAERFGLFTMQRLDISHLLFGYSTSLNIAQATYDEAPQTTTEAPSSEKTAHVSDVDLTALSQEETNADIKQLDEYFSTVSPTYTNEYTDFFKGQNVIFLSAESFSSYCIDKDLTPTLYKLYNEGFRFNNYYSPIWGVSTTDGEYVNLTGLIPKSGVWSFERSALNHSYLPFTLGMQSHTYNYQTINAYHNHTYDYYSRNLYLENIGYTYKAIGQGLELEHDVWPNSDYEMMQSTVDDYINSDSFSVYYMTVSGHGGYSYNTISQWNYDKVENLNYSDEVKGYLAANIELDKAMEYLLERLEQAGKLENTVICLTDDHYPYSLDDFNGMDELAGHELDKTFEIYKNSWLLWSGSMDEPVDVDTYCSSLDILPTLSNMLGFEYDSRMLSGTDVFSETDPLVIFLDRSWISQNGKYDANTDTYTKFENAQGEDDIDSINSIVGNKFTVSRLTLETNYFGEIFKNNYTPINLSSQ